jgi:hypothetical protein
MATQSGQAFYSAQVSDLFAAEVRNDINFFSGGRMSVNVGQLSTDEVNAILRCYKSNLPLIDRVSPAIGKDLRNQQSTQVTYDGNNNAIMGTVGTAAQNYKDAQQGYLSSGHSIALKFAMIAKGTLASQGGTKPITWPPVVGQIGVSFLDPFLLQYSNAKTSTNPAYTDYTKDTWNVPFNATLGSTLVQLLGSATYTKNTPPASSSAISAQNYYQASNNVNQRELFFIFQNGILELGTTPDIEEWILQTSLTQAYSAYVTHPLVYQTVETYKTIYQYNTPGVIPVYNDMGTYLAGLAQSTTTTHTMPMLGMAFYETALMQVPQFV